MKKPDLWIDEDSGTVHFAAHLSPEDGGAKAWQVLKEKLADHNKAQMRANDQAWNDALEAAADLLADMADREQAKPKDPDIGAAISLNAACIKVRNLRKVID